MDADLGGVASLALNHVLTEPEKGPLVKQDTAAVGVDVNTVIVRPYLSGTKCFLGSGKLGEKANEHQEPKSVHVYPQKCPATITGPGWSDPSEAGRE